GVFVIGSNAYLGSGSSSTDFWEYNTGLNSWTQMANFPGINTDGSTGFSIGGKGYLGLGVNQSSGFWAFDPSSNLWDSIAVFPAGARADVPAFVINNKAYLGTGFSCVSVSFSAQLTDWWE